MFIQMLKNQRVTFVYDVDHAEKHSPFYHWFNDKSQKYVVTDRRNSFPMAAGMDKEEAQACVMFKANEFIFRNLQANK